jgi:hypothetical protein
LKTLLPVPQIAVPEKILNKQNRIKHRQRKTGSQQRFERKGKGKG